MAREKYCLPQPRSPRNEYFEAKTGSDAPLISYPARLWEPPALLSPARPGAGGHIIREGALYSRTLLSEVRCSVQTRCSWQDAVTSLPLCFTRGKEYTVGLACCSTTKHFCHGGDPREPQLCTILYISLCLFEVEDKS